MPGTVIGGKKAVVTIKNKYGKDFYKKLGAMGGKKGHTGGFFANRELARIAGAKGGRISRRGKTAERVFWEEYQEDVTEPFILPTRESIITKLRRIWKKS